MTSMTPCPRSFMSALVPLLGTLAAAAGQRVDPERGRLIVFVQPGVSDIARRFDADHLPKIRKLAQDMHITVDVRDVGRGAPADVAITPLLVFQNHRGRSVYQGRYTDVARVRNFLRTARFLPHAGDTVTRRGAAVWRSGKTKIVAPLKIVPVTGTPPPRYDHNAFVTEATHAIERGFARFRVTDRVSVGRADRMFYMDFYPWRADDGTLFLATRIYSQFHCKEPVFSSAGESLTAPWSQRDRLFHRAAASLESAVTRLIATSTIGDGFDPVPHAAPIVDWASLGLALPAAPTGRASKPIDRAVPRRWVVGDAGPNAPPRVLFRFPAPFDMYAGEAKSIHGRLNLADTGRLEGAAGWFEVDTRSVTMGDPDLDDANRDSTVLNVARYPTSRFTIASISADGAPLAYGRRTAAVMKGRFAMKGVAVPISVRSDFEPVIVETGAPGLDMTASFQISLNAFGIEGPDGPEPARSTLVFNVHLTLTPDKSAGAAPSTSA
ncbi:MAG: YceI family protein [Phycisphaerae bacterium]